MAGRLHVGLLGLGYGLLLAGEGVGIVHFSECHICPGGLLTYCLGDTCSPQDWWGWVVLGTFGPVLEPPYVVVCFPDSHSYIVIE